MPLTAFSMSVWLWDATKAAVICPMEATNFSMCFRSHSTWASVILFGVAVGRAYLGFTLSRAISDVM